MSAHNGAQLMINLWQQLYMNSVLHSEQVVNVMLKTLKTLIESN